MAQSTMEAYLSSVSNRLNETMKRLTVIGAIMAALTVITGVYGMNFEHMPELKWRFGYFFVWVVMGAVTGGLYWFFRKKEWI
jgi:magnesium transporter